MTVKRLIPFMPQGTDNLLIQSAVAPTDRARRAWQAWTEQRPLEEASWGEVRMLPSIVARGQELGIRHDLLPRLDGIRRFVWAKSQKQLLAARPIFEPLIAHGVPIMLLKGAAMIATYPVSMGRRFMRDVDVLVPPERIDEATDLIDLAGWRNPLYTSMEQARLLHLDRAHALEFKGPNGGAIDLHRYALAPNFCAGDDDSLWARAVTGQFLGLPCLRPASEHLLVASLEHSFRRDPDQVLDWSLDAAHLIGDATLDWAQVIETTLRRNLAVPVEARLRYLSEQCGLAVPESVLVELEPLSRDPVFVEEYLANQYGGLKLPGARQRARIRAQYKRVDLRYSGPDQGMPYRFSQRKPQICLSANNRRIDIMLPDANIRRARIEIDAAVDLNSGWVCKVNCGAVLLQYLVGGSSLFSRLRRLMHAGIAIDKRIFEAQRTDKVSLFIVPRSRRRIPEVPLNVECTAELDRSSTLLIKLHLKKDNWQLK